MPTREPPHNRSTTGYRAAAVGLALVAVLLAWEFVAAFPIWSNGLGEGLSYLGGAVVLSGAAWLLWRGQVNSPWLYLLGALALLIPGLWFLRWTVWLRRMAIVIGPVHPAIVALFAAASLLCLGAAAALVYGAWQIRRSRP